MPEKDEIDAALGTEATVVTPGPKIYHGIPFEEYRLWDAVNSSLLSSVRAKTPCHAKYERENPRPSTPAFEFGRLAHLAVLEPKRFADTCRVLPDAAPRRPSDRQRNAKSPSPASIAAIDWWDAWEADGRETISEDDWKAIHAMKRSIQRNQCINYVTGGQAEVCIAWIDKPTGLLCKARLDYSQQTAWGDAITDLKTTQDASEDGFRKSVYFYNYFIQAAFYVDGWKALTGETAAYTWLAVEKAPPYISKAWEMDDRTLRAGRNAYRLLLDRWAECLKTNTYPAYGDDVEMIGLEQWQLEREGVGPAQVYAE